MSKELQELQELNGWVNQLLKNVTHSLVKVVGARKVSEEDTQEIDNYYRILRFLERYSKLFPRIVGRNEVSEKLRLIEDQLELILKTGVEDLFRP